MIENVGCGDATVIDVTVAVAVTVPVVHSSTSQLPIKSEQHSVLSTVAAVY